MKLIIDIPEEDYISVRCERLYYTGHDELAKIITKAFQNAKPYEERPQGEWVVVYEENNIKTCKCSKCGRIEDIVDFDKYPFCHCGADMRKGGAE